MAFRPALVAAAAAALLGACAAGPDYARPTLPLPTAYKELGDWKTAEPQPAASQRPWWQAFGDPTLDGLMQAAEAANQDLRQAEARYRQAHAVVDVARASLWPALGLNAGVQRARTDNGGARIANTGNLGASASWEPDLWGSVRRNIEAGTASAQASADDLAAAHLSIQAALAQDYLQLRIVDQQRALYATTTAAYARALQLTEAQRAAGVALLADVALARSQLATAQAEAVDLDDQRAQFEHAIAILTGRAPAQFDLPPAQAGQPLAAQLPRTPPGLPSALLEHRPDIAAAERRAAAANAAIGVARAAYFPQLVLGASGGFSAAALGDLFDTSSRVWSLGATLAQSVFDGGLRRAQDAQAVAAYDGAVAFYKQTVLTGFQQVEDDLASLRLLEQEARLQAQAVEAAQLAERLALAQYRAGTTPYLNVITAQTLSLTSQRSALQLRGRQFAAAVGLITATGGGWDASAPSPAASAANDEPKT